MRALWIEDHQLIGDSLEMLLQVVMPEISLDKARNLDAALQYVDAFQYQLVLLDWWLAGVDGETSITALRAAGSSVPIIVVSGDDDPHVMQRAKALGVQAYISKTVEPSALVAAIQAALPGCHASPPLPNPGAWQQATSQAAPARGVAEVFPELTPRQVEVFRSLMRGLSDKQIARELNISDTTVKTHVRAILQVVGVGRRGAATHEARARGARDI